MLAEFNSVHDIVEKLDLKLSITSKTWTKLIPHCSAKSGKNCPSIGAGDNSFSVLILVHDESHCDWHRIGSSTTWTYTAGAPLRILTAKTKALETDEVLGRDFEGGQIPVQCVKARRWQRLSTLGNWTLLSCTYSHGFEFKDLEITTPDWAPGSGKPELAFPGELWAPPQDEGLHSA